MPLALLAALGASFMLHAAAFLLPDADLSLAPEPLPMQVELPPRAPVVHAVRPPAKAKPVVRAPKRSVLPVVTETSASAAAVGQRALLDTPVEEKLSDPPASSAQAAVEAVVPQPLLDAVGSIRFAVYRGAQGLAGGAGLESIPAESRNDSVRGMEIGSAVHTWRFSEGTYQLTSVMETTGVVAFFKPYRIALESRGQLVASGLQPDRFVTWRNGKETDESAVFDWSAKVVTLARDGKSRPLSEGAQDLLSLHYQLAYIPNLAAGTSMAVVSGKKFERYRFDPLGEESTETPAGTFRTLHVQVKTDSSTELWLALERQMLPVKIRYTDRKGESFELQAVDIGKPKS